MKKTLFFGLQFLFFFLISSCGIDITVFPKIIPGASNVFSPVSVSAPTHTNSTTVNLSYGNNPSGYLEYCLLENDTDVLNCNWISGSLPSTFLISAVEETKIISAWIRNLSQVSDRVDSNQIVFDVTPPSAPTFLALQTPSTNPNQSDTPIIRVSGVIFGNTVTLYSENTCSTPGLKGSTPAAGVTADVTSSSVGSDSLISFYATQTDPAGNESVCSTAFVDYTRDTTAPILASAAVSNSSPTATTTFNLTYGAVTGSYTHYCIRDNNTSAVGCTWMAGVLPATFSVTAFSETKVLSIWIRDFAQNIANRVDTNSVVLVLGGNAPVATNLIPTSFDEDTEEMVTLVYNDADGDLGVSCAISSLVNVTETTSCSCSLGTCTVGVTGTLNYNGSASFNYTVTAGGQVSNSASSTLTIDPVDDNPTISNITDQTTDKNTATSAIAFTIDDVDDVEACSDVAGGSSLTSLVANGSIVIAGTAPNCTVTITPENNQAGSTLITLTITKNTLSNQDTFSFFVNGSGWNQEAYIKTDNNDANDVFGYSTSLSGDTLAVGAHGEDSNQTTITNGITASGDNSSAASGAIYIYKRIESSWAQEAYIKAVNNDANDFFGTNISLSGDTLAVGASNEASNQTTITNGTTASGNNSNPSSGAVYVYKRTGSSWVQQAYIKAVNNDSTNAFGSSTSLSGDTLAVGALNEGSNQTTITNGSTASSDNSNPTSGAVYVYKRTGSSWAQEAYIKAVNNDMADRFGNSTSLSGDTLAVGATGEDSNQTTITNGATASGNNSNTGSGAVYVYKRTGSSWVQEAYIKAVNNDVADAFGFSTSLSGDTLVVGAHGEDSNQTTITNGITASGNNSNSLSGAVYIYRNDLRLLDPSEFISFSNTVSSITLTWSSAGQKATGYKIAYNLGLTPPASCSLGTVVDVGNVVTTTISGLLSSSYYSFRICSYDATSTNQGYTSTFNTASATPEISGLTLSSTLDTITLTWTSGGGATAGFVIAYQAGFTSPADCSSGTVIDVGNFLTETITGLSASTQYAFRVCSYDGLMTNSFGVLGTERTLDLGWNQEAYIKAVNNDANDRFGQSTSLSGDTLAVGVFGEDSNQSTITNGTTASGDNSNSGSGAVYVYKRTGSLWAQEAYLKAVNNNTDDQFGYSTTLSGDTLAVGAISEDSNQTTITNGTSASGNNSNTASGAVYVYKRTGINWAQEAYIKAVNNDASDYFGFSISLSGNTLAVGALYESSNQSTITNGATASADNSNGQGGAVYIYKRALGLWTQESYIKSVNIDAGDEFGLSISLSGDTLSVGARSEDSNQTLITNGATASSDNSNSASGAVYVYKRTGNSWTQEAYIKAVNGEGNDWFGESTSLSGNTLVVGARNESSNQTTITNGTTASSDNSNTASGAVYVYKRTGINWAQEAYIKAVNNDASDYFGFSISLSGNTLAVGALFESSNQTTITNGSTASSVNALAYIGAVYIYKRTGSSWAQEAYIKAVNNDASDQFGASTSLSGDTLAVGAYGEDSNQTTITNGTTASGNNSNLSSGATYIYRNNARLFDPPEFTTTAKTVSSLTLSWNKAGLKTIGYKIAYAAGLIPPADCSSGTVVDVGNVLTTTISSLSHGTQYSFRICSYDVSNNLSEGVTSIFHTETYSPEVLSFSASPTKYTTTLNWTSGGGATAGFKIAYQTGTTAPNDCASGTVVDVGNVSTYQILGLTPATDYAFRICSYDGSNRLSIGIPVNTTTLDGWEQQAYIKAVNSGAEDFFGHSVSISGDTLAVGAILEDSSQNTITNGNTASANNFLINSGAVYIYKRSGNTWIQEAYIKTPNSDQNDQFGISISLSGDSLAAGAVNEASNQTIITNGNTASGDNSNFVSGAVYVFKRTGVSWAQQAYIKAVNNNAGDSFGASVSLSGDSLAVGATIESSNQTTITNGATASTNNSNANSGAVYVYKRTGNSWAQEAYIKAVNNDSGDLFGLSTSLSGDTLAVGTYLEDSNQSTIINGVLASMDNSTLSSGAVYIYKRSGTSWYQEAYIKAANNSAADFFGYVTSLSGDTLAVGAVYEDSDQTIITNGATANSNNSSPESGAVYIYQRSAGLWNQQAYIKASNNNSYDYFGVHLALNGDSLAVGALAESSNEITITNGTTASTNNSNLYSGAVYVYRRSGISWEQEAYIKASNNNASDNFGHSTSISGDTIVVGTREEASNQTTITNGTTASSDNSSSQSGAVYVYRNDNHLYDPGEFIVSGKNTTRLTLSWTSAGAYAAGYKIAYDVGLIAPVNCSSGTNQNLGNVLTVTINGLQPSTYYSFRICTYDASNNTTQGYTSTFHTDLASPEILSVTSTEEKRAITLSWTSGGGATAGFKIAHSTSNNLEPNCTNGTVVDVGNVLTHTISSLTPSTEYYFKICSYDGANVESLGIPYQATTLNLGWEQQAYIKAVNNDSLDGFGSSTSLSGDTLAVGASGEASNQTIITNGASASGNNSSTQSGAVYIYKRTGVSWAQEAYIKAVNNDANDRFGLSTSLSGDTLAVGARSEDSNQTTITNGTTASGDNSNQNSGAVYVYKRSGGLWAQEAYVKAVNNDENDLFGDSISLSGDTLAVGATGEDSNQTTITNGTTASGDNSNGLSGAVYVYKRSGGLWAQEAYVKAVNNDENDLFGDSISLSGDSLVVGTYRESSNQTTITNGVTASSENSNGLSGAVYVYKRIGNSWFQEAYIKAVNGDSGDEFGSSTSLSGDFLAVGATGEDSNQTTITNGTTASADNSSLNSGAVYIYIRIGNNWTQQAYIKASNNEPSDDFGTSVSLSGDTLVVGATGEDSYQTTITNGTTASSDNEVLNSGAVYVYKRTGSSWVQEGYIKAVNRGVNHGFGSRTSLSGDTIAVGALGEDSNQTTITNGPTASTDNFNLESGAVYIYINPDRLFDPSDIYYSSQSLNALTLNWSSGGTNAVGYRIAYAVGLIPPADCSAGIDVGNVLTYSFSSLTESTQYSFRICSYDSSNNLSPGVVQTFQTLSQSPEVLALDIITDDNTATLTWTSGGGSTSGFVIAYQASTPPADCTSGTAIDVLNVSTYQVTGLNVGTTYGFRLCSYTGAQPTSVGITRLATTTGAVAGWYQEAFIKPFNSEAGDYFGRSVSISGDRLAVGADGEDNSAQTILVSSNPQASDGSDNSSRDSGAVYIFNRTGVNWEPQAYIKSINSNRDHRFGFNVSLVGDQLAVSAIGEDSNATKITNGVNASSDTSNPNSGAVYLYQWDGTTWIQQAYIKASNSQTGDEFGKSMIFDGTTLVVGVPNEDSILTTITQGSPASTDDSVTNSGAVYIYSNETGVWVEEAYIKAVNALTLYQFGESVGLSGDTLAVGSPGEASIDTTITDGRTVSTDNSNPDTGATYIYQRTDGVWEPQAYIKSSNANRNDYFGENLALSGDVLAVGARYEDSDLTTITNGATASTNNDILNSGAVYIYKRFRGVWTEEAYIKTDNAELNDNFGAKMTLSGDTLAVSATYEDSAQTTITNGATSSGDNNSLNSGAVYLFKRVAESWSQVAYIKPPFSSEVQFGSNLDLSGDTLVVGSFQESSNVTTITNGTTASNDVSSVDSGAAYVYRNQSMLFDPPRLRINRPDSNTLRLTWDKAGTQAVSYAIAINQGNTAPSSCINGEDNFTTALLTYDLSGLGSDREFTFRICSVDGSSNYSSGVTMTVRTSP